MNIAFLSTVQGHKWPGSEYLWSACALRLMGEGHRLHVGVSGDFRGAAPLTQLEEGGAAVEFVSPGFSRMSRLLGKFSPPYRSLESFQADLLVVSSGSAYDPFYLSAVGNLLLTTRIPFIFICHFSAETFWVDEPMRQMMTRILGKALRSVFVSKENLRITERQLACSIPRPEVIVPPLCSNAPGPLPWKEPSGDEPWLMACVARLEPRWKGQDVLLEILAGECWRKRNYRLDLYGEGSEASYLERLVKHYRLEDKVSFAGFESPEEIWRHHHLQVLAARGEGGPMVVTEGMICGRIPVTTRCGFVPDYVTDGETGFLADFATPGCFDAALERAWERRADWKEMGIRACQRIQSRMGDFNAPERLHALILECLA